MYAKGKTLSGKTRIAKSIEQKVVDLDAHMFLLRTNLHKRHESASHLKAVAAELRTLVCTSSGTEGLLWRLIDELHVSDDVCVHCPLSFDLSDPINAGLQFGVHPLRRAGKGDAGIKTGRYPLRGIVKECEALFAAGQALSYEYLIKALAQQMGTAHEDDGLEPALHQLNSIFLNGVQPFEDALATISDLTLEVGERLLAVAEDRKLFARPQHTHDYGNLSISTRVFIKQLPAEDVRLFRFASYVSTVETVAAARARGISFSLSKQGKTIASIEAPYPGSFVVGNDIVANISYCSQKRRLRAVIHGAGSKLVSCDLGWVHAAELQLEEVTRNNAFVEQRFVLSHERFLSSSDLTHLQELPPNGYGMWKWSDELEQRGPFPD